MKKQIFVSYSSHDKSTVQNLCERLRVQGIDTWASFKDIQPGAKWDEAIQEALDKSTHIIVMVSEASVQSSYVRAEIEYALDNGKVVLPILISKTKLPLRWHTLEYVDLSENDNTDEFKKLVQALSLSPLLRFEQYLGDVNSYDELLRLLRENPSLFLIGENRTHTKYSEEFNDLGWYGVHGTSGGEDAFLFYFCSPYLEPILASGELSEEVARITNTAYEQVQRLIRLPKSHPMSSPNFMSVQISIVAGQNSHYTPKIMQQRTKLMAEYNSKLSTFCSWLLEQPLDEIHEVALFEDIKFSLVSYTHLLTTAKRLFK